MKQQPKTTKRYGKRKPTQPQLSESSKPYYISNGIYTEKVQVYTDGGVNGNGYAGSIGAYAFVVVEDDEVLYDYCSGQIKETTNNRMEQSAIGAALSWIGREGITEPIRIFSDSEYCVKGINLWRHAWKKKEWKGVKNEDLWKDIDEMIEKLPNVQISWIKAHNGNHYNEMCDQMCTAAITNRVAKFKEKYSTSDITQADALILAVYREIWKDTVFQKCSHGLVANITEYLQSKSLIDKPIEHKI